MAMNNNNSPNPTAAGANELRCTLCSGHFPPRQAFNCHMVRRVVNLNPHVWTRVTHHPILPPSPIPSDDSSGSDSMASLGSDSDSDSESSQSGLGSTVSGPPPPPPQPVEAAEENDPRQQTLNLLGDWEEPLADVFARKAAAVTEATRTPLDLELTLMTAPAAIVDLDLKLGL